MKLYDIDAQILECVDQETGEVIDEDRLEALEMERKKKISNVACWCKELRAMKEARSNEIKKLQAWNKSDDKKIESLERYLAVALDGEKFKDERVSISYRRSESVQVEDVMKLPEEFKRVKVEPMKDELKEAMKAGRSFEGVSIETNTSMIIK